MADVIVVLGGGINSDGSLPEIPKHRVEKGVELFKKGISDKILMTAGLSFQLDYNPPKTESKAMKDYAIQLGIPEDTTLIEEKSKDTIGNAYFTKVDFLKPNNWKNITVVTSEFHMKRTKYIFQKILGSEYKLDFVEAPSGLSEKELEKRLTGEEKILLFFKYWLSEIEDGNDDKIKEFLYTQHPAYAQNSEISKEDTIKMVKEIRGS